MNFKAVNNNGVTEGFCIIKSIENKISAKGSPYLDMTLGDSTGEINAKLWDLTNFHIKLKAFDFVKVRGTEIMYKDSAQFKIDRIRLVREEDNVSIEDYVENTGIAGEAALNAIENVISEFTDDELKTLVNAVIDEYRDKLIYWPAALKLHHALRGGLLFHTLSILRLAQGVTSVYRFVNKDLLYTGIILHDIAKIEELKASETGIATDYTVRGNLIGHLVMGAINIDRIGRENGISGDTLTLVEHMLISHHGEPEFGAAQPPMFIEAEILAELDLMDARIYEMSHEIMQKNEGEFTSRQWALNNRKLYNHGKSGEFKTDLL